jgi:multiple sugar transport system ATP-binding protein
MAKVDLVNVSKIYPGGVKAVDSINLKISDREFIVLVGPSGCGKSTTLRMIAGLEEISDGTISIGDRVVNDVPPKSRDIAMVFQNYALYPHMTVYKNMAFGLKLRGMPKAEINKRVGEAAKILEIEHLLDRKPKQLSGGQRQRVAVGRAIVREPAAFLFDEPLSNLDAKLRVTTRAELKRLHQRLRTTTIYVTHDQEEAMTLGDRIVVMKDGLIQQADTPLMTYNRPVNRFVAGFIGMPPMNFFNGAIRSANGKLTFEEGRFAGGQLTFPDNGFTLSLDSLSQVVKDRLGSRAGSHVVLGIRPEHFHLHPIAGATAGESNGNSASLKVRLNVIEPLGNDMDVYMSTGLHEHVVGRLEAQMGVTAGTEATVYVDLRKAHFFEPGETGMNLSLETTSPVKEPAHALA